LVPRLKRANATCRVAQLLRQQQHALLLLKQISTRENAKTRKPGALESRSHSAGHQFKLPLDVESLVDCALQRSPLLLSVAENGSLGRLGPLVRVLAREASLSLGIEDAGSTAESATETAQKTFHARLDSTATWTSILNVRTNLTIAMSMPSKGVASIASTKTG
jgi:hypothetical protein